MSLRQRNSALGLTDYFFSMPSFSRLLLYLVCLAFLVGFVVKALAEGFSPGAVLFGGSQGIFLLALPAFFASILAASVLSRREFRVSLKHFLFLSLASSALAGVFYVAGMLLSGYLNVPLDAFVLLANALVFLLWFASSFLLLNYHLPRSLAVALLHPFFNLAFLFFSKKLDLFEASLPAVSPVIALPKLVISSAVLLVALWGIFIVINAPAKRNFGISTVQAIALFSAQWIRGSKEIERIFSEMGENVETFANALFFKSKGKIKGVLLLPLVHYGPFGNVGGSEFPFLLRQKLEPELKAPVVVLHGMVNHDFNPVHSHSADLFVKAFTSLAKSGKNFGSAASFSRYNSERVNAFCFSASRFVLVSFSRAPLPTDDLEFSLGLALRNKFHAFDEVMLVDRHNSFSEDYSLRPGGRTYYEYEHASEELKQVSSGKVRAGFGRSAASFTPEEGVGYAGVNAVVLEVGGRRACFIVFDSNNSLPSTRNALVKRFSKQFDFVDLFTTDTHVVNNLSGVHNPLGLRCSAERISKAAGEAVSNALSDLEDVEVFAGSKKIGVRVLGASRQNELLSTLNSIVSIARIVAPIVLVGSIILALALVVRV